MSKSWFTWCKLLVSLPGVVKMHEYACKRPFVPHGKLLDGLQQGPDSYAFHDFWAA